MFKGLQIGVREVLRCAHDAKGAVFNDVSTTADARKAAFGFSAPRKHHRGGAAAEARGLSHNRP